MKISLILILIFCLLVLQAEGTPGSQDTGQAKNDTTNNKFNIFGSDELLNVSLRFDLTTFLKKAEKAGSFDGKLVFNPGQKDSVSVKVTINHRGEFRFKTCSFPPIKLTFRKAVYAVADTGKIKKIKVVTHCFAGNASDVYVLREYLVYKLYSVFTDTSFRVRLLRITYIDTGKKKPVTQFGFFIEPDNILASRTKNSVVKSMNLTQRNIKPALIDRVAIFNYMIANWDWSVPGQHNVAIFRSLTPSGSALGTAIPYDFDLCGLVNADYGVPAPEMGLSSSRDRKFTGICRDRQTVETELKYFREKKDELYAVVNDFPYLNERSKKDIIGFLDQFFDQFDRKRDFDYLVETFLNSCKKL